MHSSLKKELRSVKVGASCHKMQYNTISAMGQALIQKGTHREFLFTFNTLEFK